MINDNWSRNEFDVMDTRSRNNKYPCGCEWKCMHLFNHEKPFWLIERWRNGIQINNPFVLHSASHSTTIYPSIRNIWPVWRSIWLFFYAYTDMDSEQYFMISLFPFINPVKPIDYWKPRSNDKKNVNVYCLQSVYLPYWPLPTLYYGFSSSVE